VKVAAYQAPLLPTGSMEAIDLIRMRVAWCEAEGVEILCCPEGLLGGLADYAAHPADFAIDVESGALETVLAPLASDTVAVIVGFTEITAAGEFYNSAAVCHRGAVIGVYRKLHPAIRKSVYQPGRAMPVFTVGGLTFGILTCNDSNFAEPARIMASQGAAVLFIPSNNGLPLEKAEVVADARRADLARATENGVWVVRSDVAGRADGRVSYGSSVIVDPGGRVVQAARRLEEDLLVAEIGRDARPTPLVPRSQILPPGDRW
jgi:predicted amidohydrolase